MLPMHWQEWVAAAADSPRARYLVLGPWQADGDRLIRPRMFIQGITIMVRRCPVDLAWVFRWPGERDTWVADARLAVYDVKRHIDGRLRKLGWMLLPK